MSTRRRITIALDGRVAVFRGWQVTEFIKEAGGKPIYSGSAGGWMIDRHRLADVLAYLDERNIAVTMVDDASVEPIGSADLTVPGAGNLSVGADSMVAERLTGSRETGVGRTDPLLQGLQKNFTEDREVLRDATKNSPGSREAADDHFTGSRKNTEDGGLW